SAVLCFVGDDSISGQADDVFICSTTNLVAVLTSRQPVLHREGIRLSVNAVRQNCVRQDAPRRVSTPGQQEPGSRRVAQRPRRQRREAGRAIRGLTALALLFVLLYSGALQQGAQWFG